MYQNLKNWLGLQGNAPTTKTPPQDKAKKGKIKSDSLFAYIFSRIEVILMLAN
jgi:hypothetical protein